MDNPEKLATLGTQDTGQRLEKTKGTIKNGQSRENQRANQEWAIQRNWQHWVHKTQDEHKQNKKHNTEN